MNRRVLLIGTGAGAAAVSLGSRSFLTAAREATPVADLASPPANARVFELLGDQVYLEGVAYDPGSNQVFVGSTTDGTLFQGDLDTGDVTILSQGDPNRTTAIGLKVDDAGHLIVAGGPTGSVFVVDAASGSTVAQFSNGLGADATFVNDVAIAPNGDVFATDSFNPALYRIAAVDLETGGELTSFVEFGGTAFEYGEPGTFNANGLAITEDGSYAIVVNPSSGRLFRIDLQGGEVAEILIDGESVAFGDGVLIDGQILYVVRNQLSLIVRLELDAAVENATALEAFTDPALMFPTTIAFANERLLVVNAQFDRRETGDPALPFTVALIDIPPVAPSGTPVASPGAIPVEDATPVS